MSLVKSISPRTPHEDCIYKTGAWMPGDVKNVPDEIAKKMLRHSDVYVAANADEASHPQDVIIEPPKDDKVGEAYDAIAKMGKDALRTFVQRNFNMPVDMRQSEQKMRMYAIQLVDQHGLP